MEESQPYYPKRGCRFAKHNLSTACHDHVSGMEQFRKLYALENSFLDWRFSLSPRHFKSSRLASNPLLQFPDAQCRQYQIPRSRQRADRRAPSISS